MLDARGKNPGFDKDALHKEIARADRAASKAKVRALTEEAKANAKASCARGRAHAKATREQALEAAKAKGREARAAAKASCAISKGAHRAKLAEEKRFQADMRRIERANKSKKKKPGIAAARVKRSESDDEVRGNIPAELRALFERVKRAIKGSSRMSRTEAFLKYAEEHPREQFDVIDDGIDAMIAAHEAQLRRANPATLSPHALRALLAIEHHWAQTPQELAAAYAELIPGGYVDATGTWVLTAKGKRALEEAMRTDYVVRSIAPRGRRNPETPAATYARTHWGEKGKTARTTAHVPDPKAGPLVILGRLHSVTYATDKGRGVELFEHTFGKERRGDREHGRQSLERAPFLAFNREGLVIAGGDYVVATGGIVG